MLLMVIMDIALIKNYKNMFNKIREGLKSKKTYIIGVLMILLGILQTNSNLILEGLGLITLRAGIADAVKNSE